MVDTVVERDQIRATSVLIDARLAARGLGIATFLDRLTTGFAALGAPAPDLWGGRSGSGLGATLWRSGPFDLSPRIDPRSRGYSVVHFVCNVGSLNPGPNSVVTVHDLMHRRRLRARDRVLGTLLERCIPRAGRVVAVSDRTRASVENLFPQLEGRVEVIPHGLRRLAQPTEPRQHLLAFGGANDPRKRVDLLVEVYRRYRTHSADPLPLVVLARGGLTPPQHAALTQLGADIVHDASGDRVDALMAGAAALIYPTAEEGFGLPVVEAAEVGTPVVIDHEAKVPTEILGAHCVAVEGTDAAAWVAGLERAVDRGPVFDAMALPSWSEVADAYRCLYDEVA